MISHRHTQTHRHTDTNRPSMITQTHTQTHRHRQALHDITHTHTHPLLHSFSQCPRLDSDWKATPSSLSLGPSSTRRLQSFCVTSDKRCCTRETSKQTTNGKLFHHSPFPPPPPRPSPFPNDRLLNHPTLRLTKRQLCINRLLFCPSKAACWLLPMHKPVITYTGFPRGEWPDTCDYL